MGFVIVVDGPNFINDLQRSGKSKDYILKVLSFPALQEAIQRDLDKHGLKGHPFIHTYFVCSDKGRIGDFRGEEKQQLLLKFKNQLGVTVDEIKQSHKHGEENQVDMNVFIRMLEMGPFARPYHDEWRHLVLISSDSDFAPAIRMLSQMGAHTVVVGFDALGDKKFPEELRNESYLFLEMNKILDDMEKIIKEKPSFLL
jgi:uncharacterized LabA/DUF88 family protein